MKRTLDEIGMYAMAAKPHMQLLGTTKKNQALEAVANALNEKADYLIAENEKDMQAGKEAGISSEVPACGYDAPAQKYPALPPEVLRRSCFRKIPLRAGQGNRSCGLLPGSLLRNLPGSAS